MGKIHQKYIQKLTHLYKITPFIYFFCISVLNHNQLTCFLSYFKPSTPIMALLRCIFLTKWPHIVECRLIPVFSPLFSKHILCLTIMMRNCLQIFSPLSTGNFVYLNKQWLPTMSPKLDNFILPVILSYIFMNIFRHTALIIHTW